MEDICACVVLRKKLLPRDLLLGILSIEFVGSKLFVEFEARHEPLTLMGVMSTKEERLMFVLKYSDLYLIQTIEEFLTINHEFKLIEIKENT